jgi:hypothetical protein
MVLSSDYVKGLEPNKLETAANVHQPVCSSISPRIFSVMEFFSLNLVV